MVSAGSTVRVYYAPAWGSISLGPTGTVNGVDAGYLDADGPYDIAAVTHDNRVCCVRWYRHDKGIVWNVIVIENLGTRIYAIDVGDVDRGVIVDPSL